MFEVIVRVQLMIERRRRGEVKRGSCLSSPSLRPNKLEGSSRGGVLAVTSCPILALPLPPGGALETATPRAPLLMRDPDPSLPPRG